MFLLQEIKKLKKLESFLARIKICTIARVETARTKRRPQNDLRDVALLPPPKCVDFLLVARKTTFACSSVRMLFRPSVHEQNQSYERETESERERFASRVMR